MIEVVWVLAQAQKNSNERSSILRRALASGGDDGSSNAVCAVSRAISSPAES